MPLILNGHDHKPRSLPECLKAMHESALSVMITSNDQDERGQLANIVRTSLELYERALTGPEDESLSARVFALVGATFAYIARTVM